MVSHNAIDTIHAINNVFPFLIIHHSREKKVNRRISFYYWERSERDFTPSISLLKGWLPLDPILYEVSVIDNLRKSEIICWLSSKKSAYLVDLARYFQMTKGLNKCLIVFRSMIISILWASACRSSQVIRYCENLDSLFFNIVLSKRCHIGQ